jgi:hypothetical protein
MLKTSLLSCSLISASLSDLLWLTLTAGLPLCAALPAAPFVVCDAGDRVSVCGAAET